MALAITLLTTAIVVMIIAIALFIDARREYKLKTGKMNRNFGFGKESKSKGRKNVD